MSDQNSIDEQLQAATDALPDAPVRWNHVARRYRRRRWTIIFLLGLLGLALTIVVASGVLAGKSVIDPNYSPPFSSREYASAEVRDPRLGRGVTQLTRYLSHVESAGRRLGIGVKGEAGYMFTAGTEILGHYEERLAIQWRLRRRGSNRPVGVIVVPDVESITTLPDIRHTRMVSAWVEAPKESGEYVVDLLLLSPDGTVVCHDASAPFHVVADDLFVPYSADTYSAQLPSGWRIVSDYKSQPPQRFVTEAIGPDGMSVLIDTTPNSHGDPMESAEYVESLTASIPGYRRISLGRLVYANARAAEWSFELPGSYSTDIFVYRGGDGFAVRSKAPPERFREARRVAREVVRSIDSR